MSGNSTDPSGSRRLPSASGSARSTGTQGLWTWLRLVASQSFRADGTLSADAARIPQGCKALCLCFAVVVQLAVAFSAPVVSADDTVGPEIDSAGGADDIVKEARELWRAQRDEVVTSRITLHQFIMASRSQEAAPPRSVVLEFFTDVLVPLYEETRSVDEMKSATESFLADTGFEGGWLHFVIVESPDGLLNDNEFSNQNGTVFRDQVGRTDAGEVSVTDRHTTARLSPTHTALKMYGFADIRYVPAQNHVDAPGLITAFEEQQSGLVTLRFETPGDPAREPSVRIENGLSVAFDRSTALTTSAVYFRAGVPRIEVRQFLPTVAEPDIVLPAVSIWLNYWSGTNRDDPQISTARLNIPNDIVLNEPVGEEEFVLEAPAGATVMRLNTRGEAEGSLLVDEAVSDVAAIAQTLPADPPAPVVPLQREVGSPWKMYLLLGNVLFLLLAVAVLLKRRATRRRSG